MGAQENIETAKRGYAAFSAGDAVAAMADMVDDIEWVTPGNSAISGTVRGKQALGEHWAKFAQNGFSVTPQYWFADEQRVVVLVQGTYPGEEATDAADVLTFNTDGKLIKFQTAGDTALLERVFGSK
jgi:ketosteroid isomerase-like protein